jgi:hypothetical protein
MHAGAALAVEDLAAVVPDRVDPALLAERLQVPVDGGEPDVLAPAPQLGVDLLGAAETGQAVQRGRQGLRLPGSAHPGTADRTLSPGRRASSRLRRHKRTVQRCRRSG